MRTLRVSTWVLAGLLCAAQLATASPIDTIIGDNDGFGFGAAAVSDGSPLLNNAEPNYNLAGADRRSAAERAATDGSQQTDLYSALSNYIGSLAMAEDFDLIFPFVGDLTCGTFTVDMGGFEVDLWGPLTVSFNGVVQPHLFDFNDGQFGTAVRSFGLDATALVNANLAHSFVVNIARNGSDDGVAFDYFRFTGDAQVHDPPVPEPATWLMLGSGLAALALHRRHRAGAQ